MDLKPIFQCDLETIGQESDQDMRIHAPLQPVIDRSDSEFTLQRTKHRFDLCQLYVPRPQHRRIFGRQIQTKKLVPVALLALAHFILIDSEAKRLARNRLFCLWYPDVYEPESAA